MRSYDINAAFAIIIVTNAIFFAQLLNTLTVKGGWQFELGGMVM